jgi:hypothetical protein
MSFGIMKKGEGKTAEDVPPFGIWKNGDKSLGIRI